MLQLLEDVVALKAENAALREIRLKGLKGPPKLKPSGMEKATEPARAERKAGRRGGKIDRLVIDEERVLNQGDLRGPGAENRPPLMSRTVVASGRPLRPRAQALRARSLTAPRIAIARPHPSASRASSLEAAGVLKIESAVDHGMTRRPLQGHVLHAHRNTDFPWFATTRAKSRRTSWRFCGLAYVQRRGAGLHARPEPLGAGDRPARWAQKQALRAPRHHPVSRSGNKLCRKFSDVSGPVKASIPHPMHSCVRRHASRALERPGSSRSTKPALPRRLPRVNHMLTRPACYGSY